MKCDVFPKNIEMLKLLNILEIQLQKLRSKSQAASSIGLTVVHHNSVELFHLQAAGHFSLAKHCRFQLISSTSDQLEVVSSFESHLPLS